MFTFQRALPAYVLTDQRALRAYVLTYQSAKCLCAHVQMETPIEFVKSVEISD